MLEIDQLIKKAGGPDAIAAASAQTERAITSHAVRKWPRRGIPDDHWDLLRRLTGVSVETIHEINQAARHGSPARERAA